MDRAARNDVDLIFTNNSAWSGLNPRSRFAAFADESARIVEENGGTTQFVQVIAPQSVLESRLADDSRRAIFFLAPCQGRINEIEG